MRATIIYSTARPTPRLDWLVDDLALQAMPGDDLELVVVDALHRPAAAIGYRPIPAITRLVETAPKPCVWQGPQRATRRDWWAVSNARNTGAVLASTGYLIFVDDRCRLGPRWMAAARRASRERTSVVSGSYQKHEDGKVTIDHRCLAQPGGLSDCGGGWLFGCVIALSLAWFLEVNGFEEGCDGLSMEDSILGLMLANRGRRIDFRPELLVLQERSVGTGHGCARTDKGTSPDDKSHAALARFGTRTRTELTPDLMKLRTRVATGGGFPDVDRSVEHRDWYDGQLLADMVPPP